MIMLLDAQRKECLPGVTHGQQFWHCVPLSVAPCMQTTSHTKQVPTDQRFSLSPLTQQLLLIFSVVLFGRQLRELLRVLMKASNLGMCCFSFWNVMQYCIGSMSLPVSTSGALVQLITFFLPEVKARIFVLILKGGTFILKTEGFCHEANSSEQSRVYNDCHI